MRRFLILLPLLAGACRNACQDLCDEMASFASTCGYTWDDTSVQQCLEDQADVTADEKDVCAEYTGHVKEWWTCDDVADYFDQSGHTAGDTGR